MVRQRVWYLRNSNTPGVAETAFAYGALGDRPIVGDWNGDGYISVGVVRGTTWQLRNSNTGGNAEISFNFGAAGDVPLVWHTAVISVPAGLGERWSRLPTSERYVALTFDAGGNSAGLTSILSTLQGRQVAGTFFLTGRWAEANPAQAAQIARYYPVGNHTYSHPDLTTLSDDAVRTEVGRGHTAILTASGQDARPMFRFPFGARDARTIAIVNSLSYGGVRWTVDTLGWQGTSGGQSVDTIVRRARQPDARPDHPHARRLEPERQLHARRRRAAPGHRRAAGAWLWLRDHPRGDVAVTADGGDRIWLDERRERGHGPPWQSWLAIPVALLSGNP